VTVPDRIVIATRESALALWQARHVAQRIRSLNPQIRTELLGLTTEGDRRLGVSLAKIGGKGLFVKELEQALVEQRAHIAVHSMKDVPMHLPPGLVIAAVLAREDPRDAFVSNRFARLTDLPPGSRIGTSSLRRESQLRARHPGLQILPLRGNVQTRLRKLDEGQFEAIILAAAGLKRLSLEARIRGLLEPEESLPAAGQGAMGIECRSDSAALIALLAPLDDARTRRCVEAERAVSRALAGSCSVPLGAYATVEGGAMQLRGFVATADGSRIAADEVQGAVDVSPETLGQQLADRLIARGARDILALLESADT
jgi:hydroxymethylbilane synthase